jgi:hypothetical protein
MARKRLLLAESELNRAQLARDVSVLAGGVRALTERTSVVRSVATSAAGLVAGLATLQRNKPAQPSRMHAILQGAGIAASLWLVWRGRDTGKR